MSNLSLPVKIKDGGTSSTTASAALSALGAAASGANSDITSLASLAGSTALQISSTGAIVLKQSTANYTITWNNPAAARSYIIPDNGTPTNTNQFIIADVTAVPNPNDVIRWNGSKWVNGAVSASAAAGGSPGSVQYNSGGGLAGDSGLKYALSGLTNLALAPTWNNPASSFTAFQINALNTASQSNSLLVDFQLSSSSIYHLYISGASVQAGGLAICGSGDTGNALTMGYATSRQIFINPAPASTAGGTLYIKAGNSGAGTNLSGGVLALQGGFSTGNLGSSITLSVAPPGTSGTGTNVTATYGTLTSTGLRIGDNGSPRTTLDCGLGSLSGGVASNNYLNTFTPSSQTNFPASDIVFSNGDVVRFATQGSTVALQFIPTSNTKYGTFTSYSSAGLLLSTQNGGDVIFQPNQYEAMRLSTLGGGRVGVFTTYPYYGYQQYGGGFRLSQLDAPGSITAGSPTAGANTFYYWLVLTDHVSQQSSMSGPTTLASAANPPNVALSWPSRQGVTTYDILRTTTNTPPSGTSAVLVASVNGALSWTDNTATASLSSYTVNSSRYTGADMILDGALFVNAGGQNLPYAGDITLTNVNNATIGQGRNGYGNGPGLTIAAGSPSSGYTNGNGGPLTLSTGLSTGSGTSGIYFNICPPGASGTADNTVQTYMTLTSKGLRLGDSNSPAYGFHQFAGGQRLQSVGTPATPTITTGTPGTSYYYQVTAIDREGFSSLPSAFVGLTSNTGVTISWTAVAGASSYKVYRNQYTTGPGALVTSTTSTTFTDSAIVGGATAGEIDTTASAIIDGSLSIGTAATPRYPLDLSFTSWQLDRAVNANFTTQNNSASTIRAVMNNNGGSLSGSEAYGVYGSTTCTGMGMTAIGVYGEGLAASSGNQVVGVKGYAGSSSNSNYGVYAQASGGTVTNYGLYASAAYAPTNYDIYTASSISSFNSSGWQLRQSTANYTLTWANPAAARSYLLPDNGTPTTQNTIVVADITAPASGDVIKYNGSRWVNGGSSGYAFQNLSANTTLATTTSAAFVTGTVTITLPLASAATQPVNIKNVGTGTVTVAIQGSDTIDGASSYTIGAKNASLTFAPAGSGLWYLI